MGRRTPHVPDGARVRVLHVMSDSNFGGAGRYLITLLRGPEYAARVDAEVACPRGGALWKSLRDGGIKTHTLPGSDKSLDPGQFLPLVRIARRGRFDIVHTHASLVARIAARFVPGTRIVFTKHTMGGAGSAGIMARLQPLLADRVICVSKAVLGELARSGVPRGMLDLVYNGVETGAGAEPAGAGPRVPSAGAGGLSQGAPSQGAGSRGRDVGPVIVTTGRLEPDKGHRFLVQAMPRVLKHHRGARLWIAGDGSLRTELEALAYQLGLEKHVVFLGFVEDVPDLLSRADVFVLPSLSEALGISLLEAMAASLPVVASAVGGVPEVIEPGFNGLLVPPGDVDKIALSLLTLSGEPELALRLGKNARKTVESRFSAAQQARGTVDCYMKALRRVG